MLATWLLAATLGPVPEQPQPSPEVDLIFYGDTRGGVLQTFLNKRHRPAEIHKALAAQLGSLEDLSKQRGILFLGDAVSHGGCAKYWDDEFFPALRDLKLFQTGGDYLFYPVIGDHETYLIPESYEEAKHVPIQCDLFRQIFKEPTIKADKRLRLTRSIHAELIREKATGGPGARAIPAQTDCSPEPENLCAPHLLMSPGMPDIQKAHCLSCQYQREHCRGNCVTYVFLNEYSRDNGFGPFQDDWGQSPEGATWYKIDFQLQSGDGQARKLRVLMLDTQSDAALQAQDGKTQQTWVADRVGELDPGSFVIVAGHLPPPLRPDLYGAAFRAAFEHSVRILAILGAHYHGFGSGSYRVSREGSGKAQEVYFAISGDGGGRDFSKKEVPTQDRMVGPRIGDDIIVSPVAGSPWTADSEQNATSFGRLHITADGVEAFDYRVPLSSTQTTGRGAKGTTKSRAVVQAGKPKILRKTALSRDLLNTRKS